MAGEKDQVKGRIKEAMGVITHNEPLKRGKVGSGGREGKNREAVDKIKNVLTNNRLKRQAK